MAAGKLQVLGGPAGKSFTVVISWLSIILLVSTVVGVVLSPVLLGEFYAGDRDYSVSADVAQALSGASALVACITLFVVLTSVIIQQQQLREVQRDKHAELNGALGPDGHRKSAVPAMLGPGGRGWNR